MKQTIAEHGGDLEAVEEACANIAEVQQRSSSPVPNPDTATQAKAKRGHEDEDLLLSLRKRVDESGELLKGIGQRHPVAGNVAYANYLRDIVVCMSRTKFRKARCSFNQILTVLLDEDSDPDDAPTAYAFPARATIPSAVTFENVQLVQPSDQPKSDRCQAVMLPPSEHVYRQVNLCKWSYHAPHLHLLPWGRPDLKRAQVVVLWTKASRMTVTFLDFQPY